MEPNTSPVTARSGLIGPVDLLKSSLALYGKIWKQAIGVSIIPLIISLVGLCLAVVSALSRSIVLTAVVAIIVAVASVIFSIARIPALLEVVRSGDGGTTASIKGAYRFAFGIFWSFLLIIIIQLFISLGSFVLFIIPGIIVGVYISFSVFTRTLDGFKGFSALTESYSLVRGRWWPVFGRSLFMALIIGIVSIVISLITHGVPIIGQVILGITVVPVAFIYQYLLYNNLKATRQQVSTESFKKWLMAFLVIGIIAAILLPILGGAAALTALYQLRSSNSLNGMPNYNYPANYPMNGTGINPATGGSQNPSDYFPNGQYPGSTQQ